MEEHNEGQEYQGDQSSNNDQLFNRSGALETLSRGVDAMRSEIGKLIIGQKGMVDLIITAILADGHILLEGVPGVAKTLTAKLVARTINVDFSRIQFTPDLMPSDVLGTSVFNVKANEFEFRKGPIFSNIVLIDEINRSPAKTQAALFEVMEEKQITIDGFRHVMLPPFLVLATQNPVEQEGTYRLPEAQLDRFMFKIEVGYPTLDEEVQILNGLHQRHGKNDTTQIKPIMDADEVVNYRKIVNDIHIEDTLTRYIATIVDKTRNNNALFLGASPRASIALMNGAKALAAIRGRSFVTPDDVKALAYPVLGHRIVLNPEKEMEGVTNREVVEEIIESCEVPR